jgi:hypothetical protein
VTVKAIDPNGLVRDIRSDSSGNLSTTLGTRLAGEDLAVDAIAAAPLCNGTLVSGTATETVIKNAPGYVDAILVNTGVANATITLSDGNTNIAVITCPDTATRHWPVRVRFGTNIKVTPSNNGLSFTVVWR